MYKEQVIKNVKVKSIPSQGATLTFDSLALSEARQQTLHDYVQFADKPTRGQSIRQLDFANHTLPTRGLDNSRTDQLADSEFVNITFGASSFFSQNFASNISAS